MSNYTIFSFSKIMYVVSKCLHSALVSWTWILKAPDSIDTCNNYSKIIVSIKTYLVNEQRRAVDSMKHCEEQLPLK